MAHYYRALEVNTSQEDAFDYVADFTHAVWDPATLACEKITEGPIGVGTTFMLKAKFLTGSMDLPYTITEYVPHSRLVLEGESTLMKYVDVITFEPQQGGTVVGYDAVLNFKGLLGLGEFFFRPVFKQIGDSATDGLIKALNQIPG
jgi:hypothetical protein